MVAGIQGPLGKIIDQLKPPKSVAPTVSIDHSPDEYYFDKKPDRPEKKLFYVNRDGVKKDERRIRHGSIREQSGGDGPTMKCTIGPSVTEIPLSYDESRQYAYYMLDLTKATVRRENAQGFQAMAGAVFTMVATSLLVIGVYKGAMNNNYNQP